MLTALLRGNPLAKYPPHTFISTGRCIQTQILYSSGLDRLKKNPDIIILTTKKKKKRARLQMTKNICAEGRHPPTDWPPLTSIPAPACKMSEQTTATQVWPLSNKGRELQRAMLTCLQHAELILTSFAMLPDPGNQGFNCVPSTEETGLIW